jgi:hypothetical protein
LLTLIRNGGIPMLFILVFGLIALGTAMRYAARPGPVHLAFSRAMALATFHATLVGFCADLGAVFTKGPRIAAAEHADLSRVLIQGLAESTSPGIMGFTLLALTSLFVAVGRLRAGAPG